MNLLLFIVTIAISFVAVRIGGIAFSLTGLESSLARFQALSCFTGTGFTTRESELILSHPKRRRIISILMIIGNAGMVAVIAGLVSSFLTATSIWAVLRLVILVVALYLIYLIATHAGIMPCACRCSLSRYSELLSWSRFPNGTFLTQLPLTLV